MAARRLTDLEQRTERAKVPHKGIDVIRLSINGKERCYVCYHCAERRISEMQDGDDTVDVQRWSVPVWALDKSVRCMYSDEPKESYRLRT